MRLSFHYRHEFGYTLHAEILGIHGTVLVVGALIDHIQVVCYGAESCSVATRDMEYYPSLINIFLRAVGAIDFRFDDNGIR
jgi:hypothetical protein